MAREICLKQEYLKDEGYQDFKEWIETEGNVYTGFAGESYYVDPDDKTNLKCFKFKGSKWKNPYSSIPDVKMSLLLYVKHLFRSDLIYDINELKGKNLGCFCHSPREEWSKPKCNNQILVDLLNRYYDPIQKMITEQKIIN